jgi:GxxExxY protein
LTAEFAEDAKLDNGLNEIGQQVIGAAIRVHSTLGPGLLESAYEICLHHELSKLGLNVQRQQPLPIVYDSVKLDAGYRLDLVVEGVVLELKTVDKLQPFIPPNC